MGKINLQCKPSRDGSYTCFNKEELINLSKKWNKTHQNNKIIYVNKNKNNLWKSLRQKLSDSCGNKEWCWIDQDFARSLKPKMLKIFRPRMPKEWYYDKNTWLSSVDILKVMEQYEELHKDYRFIGPVPLDCVYSGSLACELKNMNLSRLYNKTNIRRIGIIYNLDYSWMDGSHWVGLFVDFSKKPANITYFDSTGNGPPTEIKDLIKNYQIQLSQINIPVDIEINKKVHQKDNYECGVYAMTFITQRLGGRNLERINKYRIPDKVMNKMREYFYIKSKQ